MKKVKIGVLFLIITSIFFFRLKTTSFNKKIEVGDKIKINGRIDAASGKIEKINGKYPKNRMYFLVDRVADGEKEIIGEVVKIKKKKWGDYYSIKVEKVIEKQDFIKSYIVSKVKQISKNYPIDLENFLRATIIGEGYLIGDNLKESFKYTGTTHLLVISGLHIGVIIAGLDFLLLRFNINKRVRKSLTLLILTMYILGTGFTPSIVRAYIMGAIYLLSEIFYQRNSSKKVFFIAFILSLLIFPHWIYSISFWMSYIAVFSIIFIYQKIPKPKFSNNSFVIKLIDTTILTLIIQLAMTPVMIIFFKTVPLLSFISNIIIIPIASLFIIISFLAIFLSNFYLDFLVAPIIYYIYTIMIYFIETMNQIPYLNMEL